MAKTPLTRVVFTLSKKEFRLAKQLAKREGRENAESVNLWSREVIRQYLHEFAVMPEAWDERFR